MKRNRRRRPAHELHQELARDGWLGIAMPDWFYSGFRNTGGGPGHRGRGDHDAGDRGAGGGDSVASAIHTNIFLLKPVVKFGTDDQKKRILPPLTVAPMALVPE